MSAPPLVSIITPSLNGGAFIRDAIESIAAQDYPHIEHIVIDGGSRDMTAGIVAEYGDRVTWVQEPDSGQSDAINKGFRRARGEILTWINCDDMLLPGAVSRGVEALQANPSAGLAVGTGLILDEDGNVIADSPIVPNPSPDVLADVVDFVLQPAAFFRRDRFFAVGQLRLEQHYTMDWDLFIRLSRSGPIVPISGGPIAGARVYPGTKTASGGWRRYLELLVMSRRHAGRWVTPASGSYAVETVEAMLRRTAVRLGIDIDPVRLPTSTDPLARIAGRAQRRITSRAFTAPGVVGRRAWHHDGWAGPIVDVRLPAGDGDVLIAGTVPDWCPLGVQRLAIRIGGERHCATVGPGMFVLRYPAPSTPAHVRLRADKFFTPHKDGFCRGDHRRLSWTVDALTRQ